MSLFTDWMPYHKQFAGSVYRTFDDSIAADWSGITVRSDDRRRFGVVGLGSTASWTALGTQTTSECVAGLVLLPGIYESAQVSVNGGVCRARVNTATGQLVLTYNGADVATVALPASVWTNSFTFGDCWLRLKWVVGTLTLTARVWSIAEPEPTAWSATHTAASNFAVANAIAVGWTGSSYEQAFHWLSYDSVLGPCPTPRRATDPGSYDAWFKRAALGQAQRVMTAEVFVPAVETASTRRPSVMRAATDTYNSGGAWPFENAVFPGILLNYVDADYALPDAINGRQKIGVSALRISNPNGINDAWIRAHNLKAPIVLRYGDPSWPYYDLEVVFTGEAGSVGDSNGEITLSIRDGMARFDRAVQDEFLTTQSGKPVPVSIGECYNVSPALIDSALLVYKVHDGAIAGITEVRDKGVPLSSLFVGTLEAFDAANDWVRFTAPHNLSVDSEVAFSGGTLPAPLIAGANYLVHTVVDAERVKLKSGLAGGVIDLTGSDTLSVTGTFPSSNTIRTSAAHSMTAGSSFRIGGTAPGGATAGVRYYALAAGLTSDEVSFSTSPGGGAVDLTATASFAMSAVSAASDFIQLSAVHAFALDAPLAVEAAVLPTPIVKGVYFRGTATFADAVKLRSVAGGADIDITGVTASSGTVSANQSGYTITRWLGATCTKSAVAPNLSAGEFRLQTNPAGQITVDLQGALVNGLYSATGAQAVRYLLGDRPTVSDRFRRYDVWTTGIGYHIADPLSVADALDTLAAPQRAVWGTNRIGTLISQPIDADTLVTINLDSGTIGRPTIEGKALPNAVNQPAPYYRRNWTQQSASDFAGSVTEENRRRWALDYFEQDSAVSVFPAVDNGTIGERLPVERVATIGAASSGNPYQPPGKQRLTVTFTVRWTRLNQLTLGSRINVSSSRSALTAALGQGFLITKLAERLSDHTLRVTGVLPIDGFFPTT